jgi:cell division protein FtsL
MKGFSFMTKKISMFLICAIFLSACGVVDVNQLLGIPPTPTKVPPPTMTNIPADTPTVTPTVPTPTYTLTPTFVGEKTKTFTPEATATVLLITATSIATSDLIFTPQVPMVGFVGVTLSSNVFYKRKQCSPNSVKFTVQVAEPEKVSFVVLFVRFKSKLTSSTSKWTSITMEKQALGAGTFIHELIPEEMKAVDSFENAWVEYQVVSTDINSKQVGKTGIFNEKLLLPECSPNKEPSPTIESTVDLTTTATVTPTATAKK